MIDTYMAMMIDDGTYCDGDPLLAQASGKAIGIDNSGFKNLLLILISDETCDEVIPKGQDTTKTKVCCLSQGHFSSPLANSQIMT